MHRKRGGMALLLTVMLLLVSGCASGPDRTPMLHITLTASRDLNPNKRGQPSPVLVRIYELATPDDFQEAGFFRLYDHDKEVLGSNLVTRAVRIMLPGQTREVTQPLTARTRVVAVLVAYRDIDHAQWRALCPLSRDDGSAISVDLRAGTVRVREKTDK